ncbi:MAG: TetR family transcriptional regulator [Myxococcales bacterium]|nr:TetR family transcriptional regulator [Myxococcales bacterium]
MTRRARRAYKKSDESRELVLDAAIAQIAANGIGKTSVQDIATAAGLSKGLVHYHFDSKVDLYREVLVRSCDFMRVRIQAAFELPGSPLERVRRALHEMWSMRRDGAPHVRVLSEIALVARVEPEMGQALGEALRKAREQMIEIGFKELVALGVRPRVSPPVAARLLLATLDGLGIQQMFDPLTSDEEVEVLRALDLTSMAMFEL